MSLNAALSSASPGLFWPSAECFTHVPAKKNKDFVAGDCLNNLVSLYKQSSWFQDWKYLFGFLNALQCIAMNPARVLL